MLSKDTASTNDDYDDELLALSLKWLDLKHDLRKHIKNFEPKSKKVFNDLYAKCIHREKHNNEKCIICLSSTDISNYNITCIQQHKSKLRKYIHQLTKKSNYVFSPFHSNKNYTKNKWSSQRIKKMHSYSSEYAHKYKRTDNKKQTVWKTKTKPSLRKKKRYSITSTCKSELRNYINNINLSDSDDDYLDFSCSYNPVIEWDFCICKKRYMTHEMEKCIKCNKYTCYKCALGCLCTICIESDYLKEFSDCLDYYIGDILDRNIINIITIYCSGYFELKCCNLYDCNNTILIKDVSCLINGLDTKYNSTIYYYQARNYALANSRHIYGFDIIIFCATCSENKLRKCRYHKHAFYREFGNNVYEPAKCWNKEAANNICQIHRDPKNKFKSSFVEKIKQDKKMRRKSSNEIVIGSYKRYNWADWPWYKPMPRIAATPIGLESWIKQKNQYQVYNKKTLRSNYRKVYELNEQEKETDALINGIKKPNKRYRKKKGFVNVFTSTYYMHVEKKHMNKI